MRNTAVYHRYELSSRRHFWIVVQPSKGYYAQVGAILERSCSDTGVECLLSPACFLSTSRYWEDYIVHLQGRMSALVSFCLVNPSEGD